MFKKLTFKQSYVIILYVFNRLEEKLFSLSKNNFIIVLTLFYLFLRVSLLIFYDGVLGTDEDFSFLNTASCLIENGTYCKPNHVGKYNEISYVIQSLLTLPFYFIFGKSDFSFYFGAIFLSALTLIVLFKIVDKYFGTKEAVLCSLGFVLTPIGLSLFSNSGGGYPGRHLYLIVCLLLYHILKEYKFSYKSQFFSLIVLLALSPYFIFLIPLFLFSMIQKSKLPKIYLAVSLMIMLILFEFFTKKAFSKLKLFFAEFDLIELPIILNKFMDYLIRPFTGGTPYKGLFAQSFQIPNRLEEVQWLTYTSVLIFAGLILYTLFRKLKEKKFDLIIISALLLFLFNVLYFIFKFYLAFGEVRPLGGMLHYLHLPLYLALISIGITIARHINMRIFYYSFLGINLFANFYAINFNKTPNYRIYDLGDHYLEYHFQEYPFNRYKIFKQEYLKDYLNIVLIGRYSREMDPLIPSTILKSKEELMFYGLGLKLYFGNKKGNNFCDYLSLSEAKEYCKLGYKMDIEETKKLYKGSTPNLKKLMRVLDEINTNSADLGGSHFLEKV